MESLSNTVCTGRTCLKPLIVNHRKVQFNIPICKLETGFWARKIEIQFLRETRANLERNATFFVQSVDNRQEGVDDWQLQFLGQPEKVASDLAGKKKQQKSRLLEDTDSMDWCVRARTIALKSIEARGMKHHVEKLVNAKKKKNKNKKVVKKGKGDKKIKTDEEEEKEVESDFEDEFDSSNISQVGDIDYLRRTVSMLGDGMFEERKQKTMETFIDRLSQFDGPSDHKKEINLNKAIVDAQTAHEVLDVVSEVIAAVGKGLSPSPLSPLNIATALHRIAKNMEKVSMMRTHRLALARSREMSMLVGIAMTALPECSAQGISNIAWALSKIGEELLYLTEMDRVAEVALTKVGELNSQNVANVAGAFASMQHSAPDLFAELSERASSIVSTFRGQEIAQLLWAFASLNEPAGPLLEALDSVFKDADQFKCKHQLSQDQNLDLGSLAFHDSTASDRPVISFNRDQLGSIAWSYAVLGELDRTFFAGIWNTLRNFDEKKISDQYREDVMFASQIYLVNQCLKLEYPHLNLTLCSDVEERIVRAGKTRRFNEKVSSSFQKEVARLLHSTGLNWVREYDINAYTLDAVLVDQKIAMEIDGPSHFSRNSGALMGHTVLKRRYVTAAGWKLVAVPYQEFEEQRGSFEQLEYLRKLLEEYIGDNSGKVGQAQLPSL